jgi:hypothetical protein
MPGKLLHPAVLLSLAVLLYAGAQYLWFVRADRVRATLVLWGGCLILHLTLNRYHGLMNSPSLQLLLGLFWGVPGLLYAGLATQFGPSDDGELPGILRWLAELLCGVYFVAIWICWFFWPDLLFVLQPGVLLAALFMMRPDPQSPPIFVALAFVYAVVLYLAYAPIAAAGDIDPPAMWFAQRAVMAGFWALAPLAILSDALSRTRVMALIACIAFSTLIQIQMDTQSVYLIVLGISGVLLLGGRALRRRRK